VAMTYGGGQNWTAEINAGVRAVGSGNSVGAVSNRLIFGSTNVTPSNWALNGWLRFLRYWSRALSATELAQVTT
jgi:hypothetical protein